MYAVISFCMKISVNSRSGSVEVSSRVDNSSVDVGAEVNTGDVNIDSENGIVSTEIVDQVSPKEIVEKSNPDSLSLGELENVGKWADAVAISDRILVQLAGSRRWTSKLLSEIISSSTSSGSAALKYYWSKEEIQVIERYLYVLGEKIKACYADEAGDSLRWNGHKFSDMMDQPVKTDSDVKFKSIQSTDFESKVKGWIIDALGNTEFRDILGRVITITGGLMTDDFIAGMTGAGTGIVNKSEVHTDRGVFRKYIEVLALVVSKMYWREDGSVYLQPGGR